MYFCGKTACFVTAKVSETNFIVHVFSCEFLVEKSQLIELIKRPYKYIFSYVMHAKHRNIYMLMYLDLFIMYTIEAFEIKTPWQMEVIK